VILAVDRCDDICGVYRPIRVQVDYRENPRLWEIPIRVEEYESLGIVTIKTSVRSDVPKISESYIYERVADIIRYYSSQKLTKGLIRFAGEKISLDIAVRNDFLMNERDEMMFDWRGLHFRGLIEDFFPQARFSLSWRACLEIIEKRGQEYQKKYPDLAEKKEWTSKGWIIHALAHELAHLIVGGKDLAIEKKPLSEIISEIFAARYDWDKIKSGDKDAISIPGRSYLRNQWSELGVDPNDSVLCSRLLKEALEAHLTSSDDEFRPFWPVFKPRG
jgi:hypothetical protein